MLLTCGLRRHPTRSHTAGSTLYVVPSSAPARVRHWPGQGLRSLLSGYVDTLHCLPFCFLSSLSPCFLPSAFPLQVRLSPVIVSTKGTALSDRGLAQSVPRRTGVSDMNSHFESRR